MTPTASPPPEAIRQQMARIEASPEFAGSARLLAFLRFIVEETLAGAATALKEVVIGNALYGREPPYDSRIDSTVRVEARRLRRKLLDYQSGSGRTDPVVISLPVGGYVPSFAPRGERHPEPAARDNIFRPGEGAVVAVIPLRAISPDPALEGFADGLTDELIYTLGQSEGLWLPSRSSTFQYKGHDRPAAELARALNADAVLQGAVRLDGGLLRVTIELSDTEGMIVWSDRFDAPAGQPRQFQEKIARTLLSRVRFDSSRMREMRIAPGPQALRAHAKVYRARLLLDQQTPDSVAKAMALFRQVAEAAPDYARGHTGIADCHCDLFRLGLMGREEAMRGAGAAAEAALAIDPGSVEAHAARATILAWMARDPPAAEAAFEEALRLAPNARACRHYGVLLALFGEEEHAELLFREAREIEPFSASQDIAEAIAHYHARRFAQLRPGPLPPEALAHVVLGQVFAGDAAGATAQLPEAERLCARHPELLFLGPEVEAWLGAPARARRLGAAALARGTCYARATLAAALGEAERALDALDAALEAGELSTAWIRTDARFDALRGLPRFQSLLERLRPRR
ncbi:hypothetical protein EOD42_20810 [Rhodovarius crocodyli]|uniref:Tetratricopeptide repeat protein n=1 Tax=Rhodovarius crocodyli TaxID=1979269 RepID=A0A437M2J5_9PROT|nr:hypothetical protein [Rhodovarius crocodyli]RVT91763.1 hypothetical protein EOD42_20810 [Rhodovarius crocodyli]